MPDRDGYEIQARFRDYVLHHDCDTQVVNTPTAKRTHLRACRAEQRRQAREAQKQRTREATARLRNINKLRKEARL